MKTFGAFLMRSQRNAMLLAFAVALLPILHWFSVIIMALITLRRGAKQGALILISILLAVALLTLVSRNSLLIYTVAFSALLVWLLAIILHYKHNWSLVLLIGTGLAIFSIIPIHVYVTDLDVWWQHRIFDYWQQISGDMSMNMLQQKQAIIYLSKIATGLQISAMLLLNLTWLLLARYWQALLYNPGALRAELHAIRMPRWVSLCLLVLLIIVLLWRLPLLIDLLPVVFLPFVCAGLSLIHCVLVASKTNAMWLLVLYVLLIFALPYVCVALVILALADSVMNLRQRYQTSS